MERPLVVTDSSENVVEIIREAGELAADTDSPLTVLTVVTESEYEKDAEVLGTIEAVEGSSYDLGPVAYAKEVAQTAIADLLSDLDIEIEAIGKFVDDDSDRADAILEVAAENDCDYVFLMGRRRSPTGKAIFGDTAQSVILNFDGYVVTMSE
ncbi:universal stress protein [Halomontanus rarus]|uniref:universal stress protein n=1 Tax=Halomontanus rarus TaxID=3034020 RepID=UPI001A99AB21